MRLRQSFSLENSYFSLSFSCFYSVSLLNISLQLLTSLAISVTCVWSTMLWSGPKSPGSYLWRPINCSKFACGFTFPALFWATFQDQKLKRKVSKYSLRNPKNFRTSEPFQIFELEVLSSISNSRNGFERNLLSSDSVAKSAAILTIKQGLSVDVLIKHTVKHSSIYTCFASSVFLFSFEGSRKKNSKEDWSTVSCFATYTCNYQFFSMATPPPLRVHLGDLHWQGGGKQISVAHGDPSEPICF